MISFFRHIFISFLLLISLGCSFDTKTGIWKNKNEQKAENVKLIKLSQNKSEIQGELNSGKTISFSSKTKNNKTWLTAGLNNYNFTGHLQFNGKTENFSKLKFSGIDYNDIKENPLIVGKNYIITVDSKGSILKFTNDKKLQWKKNIYEKRRIRKKIKNISLAAFNNKLYGADNLGNYFAININNGETIWLKKHKGTFNSQIKVVDGKLFLVDNDNIIICFSANNGNKVWSFKTKSSFIKSKKRLSIIATRDALFSSNSSGDITKLKINNGEALWLMPTQNTLIEHETNFLETSDIVLSDKNIFFSNNFSKIYSLNTETGILNWVQNTSSTLRPTIINDNLFTISKKGYLIVFNKMTGKVIKSKYILNKFDEKKRKRILIHGFLIASNKIYITTNLGYLIICSASTGNVENILRLSRSALSEPVISNNKLYILTDSSVIVFN